MKFIITQDEATAKQMIACGFQLVSNVGKTYTFLNQLTKGNILCSFDNKKYVFSNILSI